MKNQPIGNSEKRWDAIAKVTGKADYTDDIPMKNLAYGKILRATIAHGIVKSYDISEALKVEGVLKILTPDDVPSTKFPTAGHPYSLDPSHKDIEDRTILTKHVLLYGDEIGAVVAETELAAAIAVSKIKVEYEEFPFYLTSEQSLVDGAIELHEGTKNVLASTNVVVGLVEQGFEQSDYIIKDEYKTQIVQHCHMENQVAVAYKDSDNRWVCVSSTQIPHICRRILGQTFSQPWGNFRVIKPFIGGGFGNKQDVTIEPLTVAMSMALNGRPVRLALEREESLAFTRVRHAIKYKMKVGVSKSGQIVAFKVDSICENGAYASHGHSIAVKGAGILATLYNVPNMEFNAKTVYTNTATAGAMRGYGVPQVVFAIESMIDKICLNYGFDKFEFRLNNFQKEGVPHPLNKIIMETNKVAECLILGREKFNYDEKLKLAQATSNQLIKRGVGFAAFSYATGVYPYSIEISGCRLVLNQDASVKMFVGATEIGQGSDTVFAQMVAQILSIPYENVYANALTDTDFSPFDPGAYASRQSYVCGKAVKAAALDLKLKILQTAQKFHGGETHDFDIENGNIISTKNGEIVESLGDLALKSYYGISLAECLTAEVSVNCHENSFPMGVTFVEVSVDVETGEVNVLSMLNVHDSGIILNPLLATGQVEGGMAMGISYALSEQMIYDQKTGKPLNNNLLDYKMPTTMDVCELDCAFVESYDNSAPFGNKGLGEPPLCSPGGAIRNAVCNALSLEINALPLTAGNVYNAIQKGAN